MPFIGDNGNKTKTPNTGAAGSDKPLIKSVQQAASDAPKAPKFLSTYTLKLNNGSTYELTQSQVDWVKNRYQSTVAEAKDYDFGKTYRDTTLDKKLLSAGLPSEKYIEKFISAYSDWYGDGQSYNFDGGMKNTIANKFKSDWEYEYTIEDQKRKAAGQMPLAIEAKYGDNRRDYDLMQQGLPPEAMLTDYVGAYEKVEYETAKKNQLYDTATIKIMEAERALGGYKQLSDEERIKIFDEVYADAQYDDIRQLWQKSPVEDKSDGVTDSLAELDSKWSKAGKKEATSDEPAISWTDFIGGYEKRKSGVLVDQAAYDTAIAETKKQTTASLTNKDEVRQYVDSRSADRPAEIFADMYGAGLSIGRVREAKDYLWGKATTKEEKDAIKSAFGQAVDAYNADSAEAVFGFVSDIFSEEKRAERKAAREGKRSGDAAVKNGVVALFDQGATSTIDADDAEKIFKSHLVYDENGKPTKESIALATNMMYEAGATTPIVLEVGKRAGMKSGIFSQDYADKQKETLQDSMMGAYEAQVSGTEPVAEQKSPNDLTAFNSAFSDVVVERDLAQRKEHIDASYKANVESGNMTSSDFYNAVRRAGWGDAIDVAKDAESYYKEVYAPKFEKNGEQLPKWEEIDQAAFIENFESGKDMNPDIHKTPEELTRGYLSRAFTTGVFEVISGSVGLADMATAKISGRTELWDITKLANEATDASRGVASNQSVGSRIGGLAAMASETLVNMYALSQIGSGVLSMFSKGASAVSGAVSSTNAGNILSTVISNSAAATKGASTIVNASKRVVKSSPFIANAMGNYYSEAMTNGANVSQATVYGVIGGLIEGATEAVGAELWIGRAIGSNAVAKSIIKTATSGTLKGGSIAGKAVLINLVASSLGNGFEEMASYAGTWLVKKNTYDKDAQFSLAEMWDNGKMGMLVGLLGAGLGAAEDTNSNVIAKFLSTKKGMEWASNEGIGSIHDLFIDSVIADSQTEQLKRAVVYQDSVQSSEEHKATWNDIEAMTRQLDEGQIKFDKDIAKIDAELAKKQNAVTLLTTNLEQAASDKSAAGMKKWSKIAAQLQVAQEELQVEQKQADQKRTETIKAHNESVAQQNIALEKAQARYAAHSIGMTIAFENEIKALKSVNPDMAVLGKQILSKMDAARAGKLKDYIKAYNDALTTSPAQPAGDAQSVEAPTAQPTAENAYTGAEMASDMQSATTDSAGNIKSVGTDANSIDSAYASAVASGDLESAQQILDDVAQQSGYTIKAYHGSPVSDITEFNTEASGRKSTKYQLLFGTHFTQNEEVANQYTKKAAGSVGTSRIKENGQGRVYSMYINPRTMLDIATPTMATSGQEIYELYYKLPPEIRAKVEKRNQRWVSEYTARDQENGLSGKYVHSAAIESALNLMSPKDAQTFLIANGYESVKYTATYDSGRIGSYKPDPSYIALKSDMIKSADAVVRDETGNVIPPSKRFDIPQATPANPAETMDLATQARIVALGSQLGSKVEFKPMDAWADGAYENGNIILNANKMTSEEATKRVLIHEMTHSIEGTEQYNELSEFVISTLESQSGLKRDALYNSIMRAYSDASGGAVQLDAITARKELVSRYAQENLFTDESAIQSLVNNHVGVARKFLGWIQYQIGKLNARINKNPEAATLLTAERLYIKAFNAAGKNAAGSSRQSSADSQNADARDGANRYSVATNQTLDALIQKYGAIEQGMDPRARDTEVPTQINDERYVSKFMRSVTESAHIADDLLPEIQSALVADEIGTYSRISNQETLANAQKYIAKKGGVSNAMVAFHNAVVDDTISVSKAAEMAAVGMQLAADAAERGDNISVVDLVTDLAIIAPQAGRFTQIYAMLKKMGGVGQAVYVQKMVDHINETNKQISKGKAPQIVVDAALMQQLAQAKTMDEIRVAEDAVFQYIGARTPLTPSQAISNWRYFAMLANPLTHIRNVTSNAAMSGLRASKNAVAAGIESLAVKSGFMEQSDRTHAVYNKKANPEIVKYAETMWNQYQTDAQGGGKFGIESELRKYAKQSNIAWLDKLMKGNSKLLSDVEDVQWFLRPAFIDSFSQYMIAQGLTAETITAKQRGQAAAYAIEEAQKATFREDSWLASWLQQLSNHNLAGKIAVEGVLPFKKTPINVAKAAFEYSPAGMIKGMVELFGVKNGKVDASVAIDNFSKGFVGSTLMGMGMLLAHLGILRAKGDENENYEAFLKGNGEQPYSLNFGDVSISIAQIAPATIPLFMGARMYELASNSEDELTISDFINVFAGILDPMTELSFLSGVNRVLSTTGTSDSGLGKIGQIGVNAVQNLSMQFLPSVTAKFTQFVDPIQRTTKTSKASPVGSTLDYWARAAAYKTPAEFALEPLVDVWGEKVQKDSFGEYLLDFGNKFVFPTTVKVKDRDAVNLEIMRVFEQTGNPDMLPTSPQKYVEFEGVKYDMTAEQYTAYSEEYGQAVYSAVKARMLSSDYNGASDDRKAELLKSAIESAEKTIRDKWKIYMRDNN